MLVAIALFVVFEGRFGGAGAAASFDLSGLRGDALGNPVLCRQLARDLRPPVVLRAVRRPVAAQAHLVARDRRAVLPALAAASWCSSAALARNWRRLGLARARWRVAGLGRALWACSTTPWRRSVPRLLRDRHAHLRPVGGRRLALVVAARPPAGSRGPGASCTWPLRCAPSRSASSGCAQAPRAGCRPAGCSAAASWSARCWRPSSSPTCARSTVGPLGRMLSLRPLRWLGHISYGVYLWHLPVIVYCTAARDRRLGRVARRAAHRDHARYRHAQLLPRRAPTAPARPMRGSRGARSAPLAALVTAAVIVISTLPAVAAPAAVGPRGPGDRHRGRPGAGIGGFAIRCRSRSGRVSRVDPAQPLRLMVIGDSVPFVAEPGLAAAFGATGEVTLGEKAMPGFGLTTAPLGAPLCPVSSPRRTRS